MVTAQTAQVTRTITAVIKGRMEKTSNRGPYLAVQVLRQGMQFPETFNCWDPKQLEHVKVNASATLILNRDNLKTDKEDDGQIASYWWSIAGVADEATAEETVSPPEGQAHPSGKGQSRAYANMSDPRLREESEPQSPALRRTWDATGASIERQVALKAAVELAGYKIAAGKDVGAKEVMQVATLFDRWLGRYFDVEVERESAEAGELPA